MVPKLFDPGCDVHCCRVPVVVIGVPRSCAKSASHSRVTCVKETTLADLSAVLGSTVRGTLRIGSIRDL